MAERLPDTYNIPWDQGAVRAVYKKGENPEEFVEYLKKLVRELYRMYQQIANSMNDHSANHSRGAYDEINGDRVDIDWDPSNFTPTADGVYANHKDHLVSHLNGIDLALPMIGTSRPAAAVGYRGKFYITLGGAGVADTIDICLKNAANAYVWVNIA